MNISTRFGEEFLIPIMLKSNKETSCSTPHVLYTLKHKPGVTFVPFLSILNYD